MPCRDEALNREGDDATPDEVYSDHETVAASRVPETEAGTLATRPAPAWTFLTGPLSHVSSTAIRNRAKAKQQTVAKKAQPPASLPWKKANTAPEQEISAPQSGPERLTVADA